MTDQVWSWLAAGIGLVGFWLSGRKVWWSWYVNIVNQVAWFVFAMITGYYAFILTSVLYFLVFSRNAYLWTKEHFAEKKRIDKLIGYSKKDADRTMQLYKGTDALRPLKFPTNTAIQHIVRLDNQVPICWMPYDPNTFVVSKYDGTGEACVPCKNVLDRWNNEDPFGLVRIEGKPEDRE